MNYYFIETADGTREAKDFMEWAKWYETADRCVKQTYVDKVLISTVFLGMNHQYDPKRPPLLYETMVFDAPDDSMVESEMARYPTREEALEGHDAMVRRVITRCRIPAELSIGAPRDETPTGGD